MCWMMWADGMTLADGGAEDFAIVPLKYEVSGEAQSIIIYVHVVIWCELP